MLQTVALRYKWNPEILILIQVTQHVFVCLKEIIDDVKKELHKVKDEIIKGEFWLSSVVFGSSYEAPQCMYNAWMMTMCCILMTLDVVNAVLLQELQNGQPKDEESWKRLKNGWRKWWTHVNVLSCNAEKNSQIFPWIVIFYKLEHVFFFLFLQFLVTQDSLCSS